MNRAILILLAIIVIVVSAACECRAEDQPAAAPAVPAAAPSKAAPAPPPQQPAPATIKPAAQTDTPGERCVQHTAVVDKDGNFVKSKDTGKELTARQHALEEISAELKSNAHQTGGSLESTSYLMPAGASFKVAINEPYKAAQRYFAYVEPSAKRGNRNYVNMDGFIEGDHVGAVQIPDNDSLVKANRVDPGATLLTLQVPDSVGGFWQPVDLYVWSCNGGSVRSRSMLTINATSWYDSLWIVVPLVFLLYWGAALATKVTDVKSDIPLLRYFDPVYMTAGPDGKGSLSKLQILFFSLIVFGLLSYILGRTGALSDLSSSILLLLGITGVGSAAARGTDEQKNRLSTENHLWLIGKGWLDEGGWAAVNKASWHDIITNDGGEFDVYRYQSCIFSLTVGGALLINGVNQLASFTIPETLLGILGLSQVVYIGGKLVSTSSVAELDATVKSAREAEKTYTDVATAKPDGDAKPGAVPTVESAFDDYMNKAKAARILFKSLTGKTIPDDKLNPAKKLKPASDESKPTDESKSADESQPAVANAEERPNGSPS
jgi:hypothetical protein